MLLVFPSGTYFCFKGQCGYYFWGVHGHDAVWHLAIAETSFNKFPFIAPTYSGERLYGYNWLLDFFIFLLAKLGIPSLVSYFKLIPVAWFIVFTLLTIKLGRRINDNKIFVGVLLFVSYFSTSFSYLITLYKNYSIVGSSSLISELPMHSMSNLPFAVSIIFFLWLLVQIKENKLNLKKALILSLCVFMIMGLKFYGGIISLFLVLIHLILNLLPKDVKKFITYSLIIGLIVGIGILIFYNPFLSVKSGAPFAFVPFALVHTITEDSRFFYNRYLTDARYYLLHFRIGPRLILIELINLFLFLFFFLGIRMFGLLYLFFQLLKRKVDKFDLTLLLTVLFSISLTISLVQKGEWWNTVQFFIYGIFLLNIYTSRFIYSLINSGKVYLFLAIVVITLSIPTTIDLVRLFTLNSASTYLPQMEIESLEFLKKQPNGVVLTSLYSNKWKNNNFLPLHRYDDTAYISAFSGKPVYLSDKAQLTITGLSYQERLKKMEKMDCSILNEVDYIYDIKELLPDEKLVSKCKLLNFRKIYQNKSINIYKKRSL